MRGAPEKSKSLNHSGLVQSGFVSSEMDDCIYSVPRSCALTKAVLLCAAAASSDLCLRINVPSLRGGEKKTSQRDRKAQLL